MPTAIIQGDTIFFAARGEQGAPIVFVHGAGSNHLVWNGQLSALAGSARAYALDLPGHGRSGRRGRNTIRSYADLVCSVLDHLSLDRAIIAGHSMGGAVAQTLAIENPDRVLGLVLVGTGARLRVLPAYLEGILSDFPRTAHLFNEAEFAPAADERLKQLSEKELTACDPEVVHGDLLACNAFDLLAKVSGIEAPALVICGSQDQMTPVKYAEYLASKIARARLRLIEGAGHMVMLEKPTEMNRTLIEWMQETVGAV